LDPAENDVVIAEDTDYETTTTTNPSECSWDSEDAVCRSDEQQRQRPPLPPDCQIVMAPSSLHGYGIFTLTDLRRSQAVLPGDVVLHVSDMIQQQQHHHFASTHYWWSAADTGGYYEGRDVVSIAPGVGMLANGGGSKTHNVLPGVPRVDEAGLTRTVSPGAGAVTAYHNWTWFVQAAELPAGREILVNYGPQWFAERQGKIMMDLLSMESSSSDPPHASRPVEELKNEGWCLDNIKAGRSALRYAGRGAFATRFLPEGSIVAPVPVLAILRESMVTVRKDAATREDVVTEQLLLIYCWGHDESSLMFYSYGPTVLSSSKWSKGETGSIE